MPRMRAMTLTALLSAAAGVLMLLNFPIPFFPPFVKMDLSNVPALVAVLAVGPGAGVMVELIKNLINIAQTTTGGVGEMASFIIGTALVLPAGLMYRHTRGIVRSLAAGTVSSVVVSAFANYYVLIPLYSRFIPMDALLAMYRAAIPAADTLPRVILFSVVPFNIIKCAVVSAITCYLARRLEKIGRI